jgi:hypothetical protein
VVFTPSSWGSQLVRHSAHQQVFWCHCRGQRGFLQGESLASNLFYFVIVLLIFFTLFLFASFYQKYKKLVPFIVIIFACLLLSC